MSRVVVASLLAAVGVFCAAASLEEALIASWEAQGRRKGNPDEYHQDKERLGREVRETNAIAEEMYRHPTAPQLTQEGVARKALPPKLLKRLVDVYKAKSTLTLEQPEGNLPASIDSPSFIVLVPKNIERDLTKHLQPLLVEWVQQELRYNNLYGIRCYTNGSVLSRHVDNPYQLASVIIPVIAEISEPWVLHIESHEPGHERQLTLDPGEVLFYESYRLPHWRPKPLQGFACNLFMHWTLPRETWDAHAMEKHEDAVNERILGEEEQRHEDL